MKKLMTLVLVATMSMSFAAPPARAAAPMQAMAVVPPMMASISVPTTAVEALATMKRLGYVSQDYVLPPGASVAAMFLLWAAMVITMLIMNALK